MLQCRVKGRRTVETLARKAMDVNGTRIAPGVEQRRVLADNVSVCVQRDRGQTEYTVLTRTQSGRLDVDERPTSPYR